MRFKSLSWFCSGLSSVGMVLGLASFVAVTPLTITERAVAQAPTVDSRKTEADRLLEKGNQQFQISQFESALTSWQKALQIYREINDREGEGGTLGSLGLAYYALGNYPKAIEFQEQSIAIAREIKDRLGEGQSLGRLGLAYYALSKYSKAIEFQEQSLAIKREIKDRLGEGQSLGGLGLAYYALGNYPKAIEFQEQSIAIAREIQNKPGEGAALSSLGLTYFGLGDHTRASKVLEQSLVIFREINNQLGESAVLSALGLVYGKLRDYPKVIEFHKRSLAIAREMGNRLSERISLDNLAQTYINLDDHAKAIEFYEQSLVITRETKDRSGEGLVLSDLGHTYRKLGKYSTAIEYQEQSLTIFREIKLKSLEGYVLGSLGLTYRRLGKYSKAIEYLERSLTIFREIKSRSGEGLTLGNLGKMFAEQQQPELAIVFYKQSVNIREGIRQDNRKLDQNLQESYTQTVARTYRELAALLINQGRIGEAQQVLEQLKIQELNDFTQGTRSPQSITQIELNKYETDIKNKHDSLIAFGIQVSKCEQNLANCPQHNQLKTQYQNLSKEFREFLETIKQQIKGTHLTTVDTATNDFLNDAQAIVQTHPNSILIYPLVLTDKTHILWSSKGAVFSKKATCLLSEKALSQKVNEFSDLLKNKGDETRLKTLGKDLYDCLIKPIESEITANNIRHLILVPDRITNYIPIGALHDGQQYLIQRFATNNIIAASKTDTGDLLPKNIPDIQTLGLGLSEKRTNYPALPHVTQELQNIIKILPGQIYMNQQFDRNALENNLQKRKILHIATHAKFNATNPLSSFFLLGDGTEYKIPDIQTLRQLSDIHLVVLSACETAQGGSNAQGLEIAGLSSYFMGKNKAKAVLGSLWTVSDQSTSLWMQQFYKYLANGKSKADAIQAVQQDFIAGKLDSKDTKTDYSHPYYWAPFILIGNGL